MRMLMNVLFPNEPFNSLVRGGTLGQTVGRILEEMRPEAVYFTEQDGMRSAILIVDVPSPSAIPALAEPWFLALDAECRFRIVMSPEDLRSSGIDSIGDKWK